MAKPDGEGFLTIAQAVEAAASELEEGTSNDSATDDPSVEETLFEADDQAESEEGEQPETDGETEAPSTDVEDAEGDEDESDEEESLFGDLDEEDDEAEPQVDLASMTFELPGVEEAVSLQELKDGYLRTADYTRKTQDVATQRKALEQEFGEAKRIYDGLKNDPLGFFSSLAKQLGVEGVEATGAKNPNFKLQDTEAFEAEVEKRVQERIDSDPEISKARQQAARVAVDQQFDRMQEERGQKIGVKDRKAVLDFAVKNDITNLDVAFDALMARVSAKRQKAQERTDRVKKTATKRSAGRVPEKDVNTPPADVGEAMERALAEMSAS